ncbi:MAG: alanine racemase [Mariprofundus sp.]
MSRPAIAHIYPEHLRYNYSLLKQRAGEAEIMAIVKANAYGHGMELIAPVLFDEGCRNFGVTDATEGHQLRLLLKTGEAEITLLSGIFDHCDATLASQNRLTPAITEATQIEQLQGAGFQGSVWLKIDTGMNRLGADDIHSMIRQCRKKNITIRGIMSHLACADMPEHPLNRQQANAFAAMTQEIAPDIPASLLNSAGMVCMPECSMDIVRPGIALYGSEPLADQPLGLKPVMQLTGAVMQIRKIPAGTTISYGATFRAGKAMRIAVVSMGYADGLPRALGNRGHAFFAGQKLAIVGRVCMDYTMLDVTGIEIKQGDAVEFWGEHISANDVARCIDTISYTLFTGVGARVQRIAE